MEGSSSSSVLNLRFSWWWRFKSWSSGLWHRDRGIMALQNNRVLPHHYTVSQSWGP